MKLPEIGDQVVYHPRPSDRVRKPDFYNGLVSHPAFVAHVHENGSYNLMAIDSGGVPYPVQSTPAASVVFVPPGGAYPEFGGWCEWCPEKVSNAANPDPFIKDKKQ